jgi:hypothetical protein
MQRPAIPRMTTDTSATANAAAAGPVRLLATSILFSAGYATVIGYFAHVDVYHQHFFDPAYSRSYNLFRVVFAAYLFWIVYFSGRCILLLSSDASQQFSNVQRVALDFFVGAAVWTLLMLALGYAGLYSRVVAICLTLPIIAASSRHLLDVASGTISALRHFHQHQIPHLVAAAIACVFAILLLMVKGLYPTGGADYFMHYFQYFVRVLENGHLWPNDVWYHYYYSKGAGLFFLAILLSDPLAASLMTFCLIIAVALAIYDLVARGKPGTLWPWVGVILFFGFFIYTPSKGPSVLNGGWGDFQKPHEISSAFLVSLLWTVTGLGLARGAARRRWWIAGALCALALPIVTAFSAVIAGAFCAMWAAACLLTGRREHILGLLGLGASAVIGLVAMLLLNYATTGLPLDNGIEYFWSILDIPKLQAWGVLPHIVLTMADRLAMAKDVLPLGSAEMRDFLRNVLRIEVLFPAILMTAAVTLSVALYACGRAASLQAGRHAPAMLPRNAYHTDWLPIAAAGTFLTTTLCAAAVVGRMQPVSFVRYTSFVLPVLAVLIAAGCQTAVLALPHTRWTARAVRIAMPFAFVAIVIAATNSGYRATVQTLVGTAARFVSGDASIYDAFVNQSGWPGRGNDPAVRPWALAVWKELGPGGRFLSSSNLTYCMLPGCRPEISNSYRSSDRFLDIMLGSPEQARAILHANGLDFFLVEMDLAVKDLLLCAPLFSPDRIQNNLGVRWSDGTHFLLTWRGPGVVPLTPTWLSQYRAKISAALCRDMPLLQSLAQELDKNPRWGADLVIPWPRR